MDQVQKDHLKSYGTTFWVLGEKIKVENEVGLSLK